MKTITLAATLSALVPGKTNGVSARRDDDRDEDEREPAVARQVVEKRRFSKASLP
jgi:hypothetical protein